MQIGSSPSAGSTTTAALSAAQVHVATDPVAAWPWRTVEAMALGVPVVGTAGASVDELVTHGQSGLLVPPGDPEALADALVEVWRGRTFPRVAPPAEMEPERAVAALLGFAGLAPGTRLV